MLDSRDNYYMIGTMNSRRLFIRREVADRITGEAHARLDSLDSGEPEELLPGAEIDKTTPREVLRAREDSINRERERRLRASKAKR
jgi:hypothetical protein